MDTYLEVLKWLGIALCISQSACFSGLNLAFFGMSRLQLEVEHSRGSQDASRVLEMRKDSNFLLTTILWGNVSSNVLLTLLSDSVMAGATAFLFSTFVITLVGEIMPQAYFSRHALTMAARLTFLIRFYQKALFLVARPTARLLDAWLGPEGVRYFRERDLRLIIQKHIDAAEADLDRIEGLGALNFLSFDDLAVSKEGEPLDPLSIIALPATIDLPVFPEIGKSKDDPFLQKVHASGHKWVVLTDEQEQPRLVLDSDAYLREVMFSSETVNPYDHCHRPIVVRSSHTLLGEVVPQLKVRPERDGDDVVDHDVILVWTDSKRVITGADLLGRLLRGITLNAAHSEADHANDALADHAADS